MSRWQSGKWLSHLADRHLHVCIFKIRISTGIFLYQLLQTMRLHFLIKFQLSYTFRSPFFPRSLGFCVWKFVGSWKSFSAGKVLATAVCLPFFFSIFYLPIKTFVNILQVLNVLSQSGAFLPCLYVCLCLPDFGFGFGGFGGAEGRLIPNEILTLGLSRFWHLRCRLNLSLIWSLDLGFLCCFCVVYVLKKKGQTSLLYLQMKYDISTFFILFIVSN